MKTGAFFIGLLAVCCIGACTGEGTSWRGTVGDSAGIRLVLNRGEGLWSPEEAWTVTPSLTVDVSIGDSAHGPQRIRAVAADASGRILVLDPSVPEVRVFDAAGGFLFAFGRADNTPVGLSGGVTDVLVLTPDTILVPDPARARLSFFSANGELLDVRTHVPQPLGQSWALAADGSLLFHGRTVSIDQEDPTRMRIWDGLVRTTRSASRFDTLIVLDYDRSQFEQIARPGVDLILNAPIWSPWRDRIAWSSLERSEILVHDAQGRLQAIVRHADWRRRPVTEDDRAALYAKLVAKARLLGADTTHLASLEIAWADSLPAITALREGPDGTLWVQLMGDVSDIDPLSINAVDPGGLGGRTWLVLDSLGRSLGTIEFPARFRLMFLTDSAAYGVTRDDHGVQRAERLALYRPAPLAKKD